MYEPTIGLEIHAQLKTQSKMFCSCSNEGDFLPPNTTICPICLAHPGTLPVPNIAAINLVIKAGLALHCQIASHSKFDRKNYFYPDLPKGYQISQYDMPLCQKGYLEIIINLTEAETNQEKPKTKKIGITRIHLEEDTGKLFHSQSTNSTLVDFNRSGSPLLELVTEPEIHSSQEAKQFCKELQLIFKTLNISAANMEKGQMRCEVNISVSSTKKLGTKVEIKNLNSFRSVEKAIEYEITRQTELLEKGETIIAETRGFDDAQEITVSQRIKEEAHDYRYFPEPDIPPLEISRQTIEKLRTEIPELPLAKRQRFCDEYGFNLYQARLITEESDVAKFVEETISELEEWIRVTDEKSWDPHRPELIQLLGNWLTSELFKLRNEHRTEFTEIKITPENFAELVTLIFEKKINSTAAQKIMRIMFDTGRDPSEVMETEKLNQTNDEDAISKIVDAVITAFPAQVAEYQNGKKPILQFLLGQVMRQSGGQAAPEVAIHLLKHKIKK